MDRREGGIMVCAYQHLAEAISEADAVVSLLGQSDKLAFPDVGRRPTLRLSFDDVQYSSGTWVAPNRKDIAELIEFARSWAGHGNLLVHCRAGSSRSPAAAMIVAMALGAPDAAKSAMRVCAARSYFRPNEMMLWLADGLLQADTSLVDIARSKAKPLRQDEWEAVRVPLSVHGSRDRHTRRHQSAKPR